MPDPTVYTLSTTTGKKGKIRIPALPGYDLYVQSKLIGAADGILLVYAQDPNSAELAPDEASIMRGGARQRRQAALEGHDRTRGHTDYCEWRHLSGASGCDSHRRDHHLLRDVAERLQPTRWFTALASEGLLGFDTTLIPAVAGGKLYIGTYLDQDHNLYCLDAKTGEKVWNYLTSGAVLGTPAVFNGTVYVGSQDSTLYALDADTGKLRWRFENTNTFFSPR